MRNPGLGAWANKGCRIMHSRLRATIVGFLAPVYRVYDIKFTLYTLYTHGLGLLLRGSWPQACHA